MLDKTNFLMKNFFSILVIFVLIDGFSIFNIHSSSYAIRLSDKRHAFDWDSLLKEERNEIKRLLAAYQRSSDRFEDFQDFFPLDRHTRKPKKSKFSDENEFFPIDRFEQETKFSTNFPTTNSDQEKPVERAERLESNLLTKNEQNRSKRNEPLFYAIVAICSFVGLIGIIGAALFWYKIQKRAEQAADSEYRSFGVSSSFENDQKISPNSTSADRKLAQSAQMFHYQQQRQQMMAQEKARLESSPTDSEDSEAEIGENGDHTVYECPGLAPTAEMEVRNPLYTETDLIIDERR